MAENENHREEIKSLLRLVTVHPDHQNGKQGYTVNYANAIDAMELYLQIWTCKGIEESFNVVLPFLQQLQQKMNSGNQMELIAFLMQNLKPIIDTTNNMALTSKQKGAQFNNELKKLI